MKRAAIIAFLAGLIPILAVYAAFVLNVHMGDDLEDRFICRPFLDGCVSISRAARSGPGLFWFRLLMLPCVILLVITWFNVRTWLQIVSPAHEGVSLPCSRLRRKAVSLDGMPKAHGPSGTARDARLTQPGPGQEIANGGLPNGQEALSVRRVAVGRLRLPRLGRSIVLLGVLGSLFLALYVVALGTEGDWYRWMRRYGVTVYFAGTALAQLLLVRVLWPQRQCVLSGALRHPIGLLTALVSFQWSLGVLSVAKRLLIDDAELVDRIENIIEWWFALPMSVVFIVIAWCLWRTFKYIRSSSFKPQ